MGALQLGDWVVDEDERLGQVIEPVAYVDFSVRVAFEETIVEVRPAVLTLVSRELPEVRPPWAGYMTARIRTARKWHQCDDAGHHQIKKGQEYVVTKAFPGHPDVDCDRPVERKLCLLCAAQYDATHPTRLKEGA